MRDRRRPCPSHASLRLCSPPSRRIASLCPRSAGLTALTAAPRRHPPIPGRQGAQHDLYVGQLRRSQPKTIGTILLRQPGNILIYGLRAHPPANGDNAAPRIILDLVRQKPAGHPMVLATPSGFGCSLYEDQPPEPSR